MRWFVVCIAVMATSFSAKAEETEMIEVARLIGAPIAEVWDAWTTKEGFNAVFDGPVLDNIRLEMGGPYEIHWDTSAAEGERGSEGCTILSFVPERMLSFTWNAPPSLGEMRGKHSYVVIDFQPLGADLTRVTLRHAGFGDGPEWEPVRAYFEPAWPWVMDQFVNHLGAPPPYPSGYLILLNPSREDFFDTGPTPEEGAAIQQHFVRLQEQMNEGAVLFAGPCTDEIGPGVVLFEATSEEEAKAFMNADPAVEAGVFTAELHPIGFSLLRERDRL